MRTCAPAGISQNANQLLRFDLLPDHNQILGAMGIKGRYPFSCSMITAFPRPFGSPEKMIVPAWADWIADPLEVVELNLKFKDGSNRIIHEEKAYPVFLSEYSSASHHFPLLPGQTMNFALKFSSSPPEWKPSQLDLEIRRLVS